MRRVLKGLGLIVGLVVLGVAGLWLFGPREPVALSAGFDARRFGEGVQVYFESVESRYDDITPGAEKRVIWRDGFKERRTPVSLLYVHGFSATSEEIRPVPDRLAEALGANLVYARLTGHGRDGAALAQARVGDWMADMAEGLAAARAVGDRVVVVATSTGGTLAVAAALDADMARDVAALILVSPNFGINDPRAGLLTWPGARWWLPMLVGETRSFVPQNAAQGRYWTTSYPTVALLPMAAMVRAVGRSAVDQITIPALFWFSPQDQVVRADLTADIAARWGGPVAVHEVRPGDGIDANNHVVAGDILSPAATGATAAAMLAWLRETLEQG